MLYKKRVRNQPATARFVSCTPNTIQKLKRKKSIFSFIVAWIKYGRHEMRNACFLVSLFRCRLIVYMNAGNRFWKYIYFGTRHSNSLENILNYLVHAKFNVYIEFDSVLKLARYFFFRENSLLCRWNWEREQFRVTVCNGWKSTKNQHLSKENIFSEIPRKIRDPAQADTGLFYRWHGC